MEKIKIKDIGVEIELPRPDSFLILKETLTRIGIESKRGNELFQSAHILHKVGKYYIVHFKTLFVLDGKEDNVTDDDIRRRNSIAKLVEQWGLCTIRDKSEVELCSPLGEIKIVPYKEKKNWTLTPKYQLGRKKVSPT